MISFPASPAPFAVPVMGFTSNSVGLVNRKGSSIAFLYQEIPKCGTEGGLIEKPPLMERCGSAKCGSDQLKLKALLIALIALVTADLAPFIFSLMLDLIALKTLETVDFALFSPELIVDFTPLIALDMVVFIVFQTVVMVDLIAFITLVMVDMIAFQTADHTVLITFSAS